MRCSHKGAILIVTLWTLLILSVLATGIAFRLSLEFRMSRYFLNEFRAEGLARAGLYRAVEAISKDEDSVDSFYECGFRLKPNEKADDLFKNIRLEDGSFSVVISDEDRRINMNTAGEGVLTAVFEILGGIRDRSHARELALNVIDWRDADHASSMQKGAEDDAYRSLSKPYECADRPLRSVEELMLVQGITPEIYQKIEKNVTVYGDPGALTLNLNTASRPVLAVIASSLGMTPENASSLAQRIDEWRSGSDRSLGTADDLIFTSPEISILEQRFQDLTSLLQANLIPVFKNFFKSYSAYYRIESIGTVDGGTAVQKKLTAVIFKKDTKGQPKFAYYHQH